MTDLPEALGVLLRSPLLAFTMAALFLCGFLMLRRLPQIRERCMLVPVLAWLGHGAGLSLLASYPAAPGPYLVLPVLGIVSFAAPFLALREASGARMPRADQGSSRRERSEMSVTPLPEDVASAERSVIGWLNGFKGKSPSQIEALLGAPERSSWDFAGKPSPLFRYKTAGGATLDIYFAADAAVTASFLLVPQ